jgi:hypothetical protein
VLIRAAGMGEGARLGRDPPPRGDPLDGVDWGDVYARALTIARPFVREQDLDDVVTEGITRVLRGQSPWDARSGRSLAEHVVRVGRDAIRSQYRKVKRRASEDFRVEAGRALEPTAAATPEESLSEEYRALIQPTLAAPLRDPLGVVNERPLRDKATRAADRPGPVRGTVERGFGDDEACMTRMITANGYVLDPSKPPPAGTIAWDGDRLLIPRHASPHDDPGQGA